MVNSVMAGYAEAAVHRRHAIGAAAPAAAPN
jgi:hypothetical protein